jgi:hypothetical protein
LKYIHKFLSCPHSFFPHIYLNVSNLPGNENCNSHLFHFKLFLTYFVFFNSFFHFSSVVKSVQLQCDVDSSLVKLYMSNIIYLADKQLIISFFKYSFGTYQRTRECYIIKVRLCIWTKKPTCVCKIFLFLCCLLF